MARRSDHDIKRSHSNRSYYYDPGTTSSNVYIESDYSDDDNPTARAYWGGGGGGGYNAGEPRVIDRSNSVRRYYLTPVNANERRSYRHIEDANCYYQEDKSRRRDYTSAAGDVELYKRPGEMNAYQENHQTASAKVGKDDKNNVVAVETKKLHTATPITIQQQPIGYSSVTVPTAGGQSPQTYAVLERRTVPASLRKCRIAALVLSLIAVICCGPCAFWCAIPSVIIAAFRPHHANRCSFAIAIVLAVLAIIVGIVVIVLSAVYGSRASKDPAGFGKLWSSSSD